MVQEITPSDDSPAKGQRPTPPSSNSKKQQRKERGLRFLSRDVKRLVEERKASSYKEVASMLIQEMRKNNKIDGMLDEDDS